jgi:hypothetical protein
MNRQSYERDLPDRDLYLVVGNLAKRHQTFVIIGLVRPPRPKMDGGNVQQTLELMGEQGAVAGQRIGLETEETDTLGGDQGTSRSTSSRARASRSRYPAAKPAQSSAAIARNGLGGGRLRSRT